MNGVRHGFGTFKDDDGDVYVGPFEDDIREGHGILTYSSGKIINGIWVKDRLNGDGTI